MGNGGRIAAVIGLGLLGACTRLVDDPLAVRSVYGGLTPNPVYRGELPRVLYSDAQTPAKQGLLYTSMFESEVAAQYAGLAVAAEVPSDVKQRARRGAVRDRSGRGAGLGSEVDRDRVRMGRRRLRRPPREPARWRTRSGTRSRAMARRRSAVRARGRGLRRQHAAPGRPGRDAQPAGARRGRPSSRRWSRSTRSRGSCMRGSDAGADAATCGLEQAKRDLGPLALPAARAAEPAGLALRPGPRVPAGRPRSRRGRRSRGSARARVA